MKQKKDKQATTKGISKGKSNGSTKGKYKKNLDKKTIIFARSKEALLNFEEAIKNNTETK